MYGEGEPPFAAVFQEQSLRCGSYLVVDMRSKDGWEDISPAGRLKYGANDRSSRFVDASAGEPWGKGTRDKTRHARHDPNMEGANYAI